MPQCFVESCSNYYEKTRFAKNIIYHMLPSDKILFSKWLEVCGKRKTKDQVPYYARICSEHFSDECYQRDLQHELLGLPLRRKLKVDAIPDQKLPNLPNRTMGAKTIKEPKETEYRILRQKPANLLCKNVNQSKHHMNKKVGKQIIIGKGSLSGKITKITSDISELLEKQKNIKKNVTIEQTKEDKNKELANLLINSADNPTMVRNKSVQGQISTKRVIKVTPPGETITIILPETELIAKNCVRSKKIFDFKKTTNDEKEDNGKINNKLYKLPMRSSYRIAKKKSIELLSDSFTEKVNQTSNRPANFSDKLKFMAKLQLKFERTENVVLPVNEAEGSLDEIIIAEPEELDSLNKMQIMEDVGEGCDANPPSSPGHAEQRQNNEVPLEDPPVNKCEELADDPDEVDIKIEENEIENLEEDIKDDKDDVKKSDDEVERKNQEENSSHSSSSEPLNNKRKLDYDSSSMKRLKTDIEDNFIAREKIIGDFFEVADCDNLEQIQSFSDQVLSEIKTLNELAKEKEQEWNHLLHMKKLKEELLIRLQRKRQVLIINNSDLSEIQPETNGQQSLLKCNQKANMLRELRAANLEKLKQRTSLLNNAFNKQKPVVDVQSIIADYRQRHPETVPRRGRRIRHSQSEGKTSIFGFSGGSLIGRKSRLDHCELPSLNGTQDDSRLSSNQNSHYRHSEEIKSYNDILLQCARLSQAEKSELQMQLTASKPPPPYPEVTVHPVTSTSSVAPTNSLLHGILTKTPSRQKANGNTKMNGGKSSFSPTLARLLTAPDKAATSTPTTMSGSLLNASNIALSAIFPGSKVRNEITITPVGSEFETPIKRELMEDESEDPVDRLVIDETLDSSNLRREDNKSEDGEDAPQCQGCNQQVAQFVCAGCGNQWYCSRDCQVTAWDDHSEVCSG